MRVVLEFFSGIGGLHYGLSLAAASTSSPKDVDVIMSFDVNTNANSTYKLNFNIDPNVRDISRLSIKDIKSILKNKFVKEKDTLVWLLSPPCQPYTKGGNSLDNEDARASGLIHLIKLLGDIYEKDKDLLPDEIFLENVPGFETSKSRILLINQLKSIGFNQILEFILSPIQIGISSDRKRYYLSASRLESSIKIIPEEIKNNDDIDYSLDDIITDLNKFNSILANNNKPLIPDSILQFNGNEKIMIDGNCGSIGRRVDNSVLNTPDLNVYLDKDIDHSYCLIPEEYILKRQRFLFDITTPFSKLVSCFTKAYGSSHIKGSGSMLIDNPNEIKELDIILNGNKDLDKTYLISVVNSKPRFFSPIEVARLHGFPIDNKEAEIHQHLDTILGTPSLAQVSFQFPVHLNNQQRWKILGNSLNVRIVAFLIRFSLFN